MNLAELRTRHADLRARLECRDLENEIRLLEYAAGEIDPVDDP